MYNSLFKYVRRFFWIIIIIFALLIGFLPFITLGLGAPFGIESLKSPELLKNMIWLIAFYTHIVCGAISLLIGWTQFLPKFRSKYKLLHRQIGKIYVVLVLMSSMAGFVICMNASGGLSAFMALFTINIVWMITTIMGFISARAGDFISHNRWMLYSYTATFSAVTLRIWLPYLTSVYQDFDRAYDQATWLSFLPNMLIVWLFVDKRLHKPNIDKINE